MRASPQRGSMGTRKGSSAFCAPTPQGTRQGMYVAFVKNAMVQKAQVRLCPHMLHGGEGVSCHESLCEWWLTFMQGQFTPYEELVAQFQMGASAIPSSKTSAASSLVQLQAWLSALTHVAPSLDRTCASLVESVAEFPWLAMPDMVADAWVRLVCAIVSARSEWVSHVASLLFQNMSLRTYASALSSCAC